MLAARVIDGWTYRRIANQYGVTPARIGQIVNTETHWLKQRPQTSRRLLFGVECLADLWKQ